MDTLDMHLRWPTICVTTNNHCNRSWSDCTMAISSLSQVSNILPASVPVFGNNWYGVRGTTRIAADDQHAFIRWSCSIICYSEIGFIIDDDVRSLDEPTYFHSRMGSQLIAPIFRNHNPKFQSSIHLWENNVPLQTVNFDKIRATRRHNEGTLMMVPFWR